MIAQSAGVHYNRVVSRLKPISEQLAKMLITIEPHDEASPSISLADNWQALLVKMLITLERHGISGSNFLHLCILTLSSHWYEKGDETSPGIILADRALLVKNAHNT